MNDRRVLVVGGGITGLAAAARLVDDASVDVELWEASDRLGGKIATSPFGGLAHVDEGADAYLRRVPHAVAFARKVGLQPDDLTSPTDAKAMVWYDDELHPIPGGIVLGVPASVRPFVTTSLLSWKGKLRAAAEPFLPRTDPADSIGALIRARFGFEVHDRLVDALVGSIYATDTDHASLAAVPQLAELAEHNRSLLLAGRAARRRNAAAAGGGPIFDAPVAGMGALVQAAGRYVVDHGGRVHTSRPVATLETGDGGWIVDGERFGAVVLAAPARHAAVVLKTVAPDAAEGLATFEHADVILVRLRCSGDDMPASSGAGQSGYLVPKSRQRLVTAVSFGSQKWAHWRPADGSQILRVSLGRDGLPVAHLDDDALIDAVVREVGGHLGVDLQPTEVSITRWIGAFPQYRPHHAERVEALAKAVPAGIHLAGASYRGIGIPACIADGERASDQAIDGTGR